MKGLFLRVILGFALLLWSIDMVFPWQEIMNAEKNQYEIIQQRHRLIVGTINNPVSYFIDKDEKKGLDYELANGFARFLNVNLEIKVFDNDEALLKALKDREIDIAAANILYSSNLSDEYQVGPGYMSASWQLVYPKNKPRPNSLNDLNSPVVIYNNTNLVQLLTDLKLKYPNLTWQKENNQTQEQLLLQVAEEKIPYTIANSIDIASVQPIRPNLTIAFDITDETDIHWYLPNSANNELQAALLEFMDGAIKEGLVDNLKEKYIHHLEKFNYVDNKYYLNAVETILPQYQAYFEKYKGDLDWRLLAAIAYQESHWNPNATSPTGVRGIMMLTKDTAQYMKVNDRTNAEESIRAGAQYMHWLLERMPETIAKDEQIWFALAAYNMGLGHLLDARRLTKELGGNPDNWLDVKKNILLLSDKRYYPRLKYGYARGYEAYQYVENIRRYTHNLINYHRLKNESTEQENIAENNVDNAKQDNKTINSLPNENNLTDKENTENKE